MKMGWFALFGTDLSGPGMLPAVIVLAVILPTAARGVFGGVVFSEVHGVATESDCEELDAQEL